MSGMAFQSRGSTGPAPQTVWFGSVVDRLNMLCPSQYSTSPYNTSIAPAHYGNLWFPIRSSLGAFTTAPDGTTNTAQLIVEDTSVTNTHFIQAGSLPNDGSISGALSPGYGVGRVRLAGFFKAATRTRIGFTVQTFGGGGGNSGILTVVFDLAGGQVGVAASTSGVAGSAVLTPAGTQILPAAQGFYLCIQDFYYKDGNFALLLATCFLDSGTGTGSLNNSYTGNGTSGVYVWRTNMMPAASWGIANTIFFDDFLSTATIDNGNTKAPGFKWYPSAGPWTNYRTGTSPMTNYSVAGSVLSILPTAGGGVTLGTATQINAAAGTYVGQGFGGSKPTLFEGRIALGYALQETSQDATWYTSSLEWIVAQGQGQTAALASQAKFPGCEFDLVESVGTALFRNRPDTDAEAYIGVSGAFGVPGNGAIASLTNYIYVMAGFPPWSSTYDYGTTNFPGQDAIVVQSGVLYQVSGNNSHNINHQPPNASFWTVITPPQAPILSDPSQMHLSSHLIIPYAGQAGITGSMAQQLTIQSGTVVSGIQEPSLGVKMSFYDGLWCNTAGFWGPNTAFNFGASYLWLCDAGHQALWLGAGGVQTMQYDHIRVMQ